jgi:site-specific recombinase XerD
MFPLMPARCAAVRPDSSIFSKGENMPANTLSSLIGRFFTEHLRAQRNLSAHTIASYRDTFRLLLQFLPAHLGVRIEALALQSFSTENILAFLDHLERSRKNSPRTRNNRLAAIRSFARYVLHLADPDSLAHAHRILSIPLKRSTKSMFGYFSREEIEQVLATPDQSTWTGRRDHLLFTLLYNTGARISEALQVTPDDLRARTLLLHGKGRKDRAVPLWTKTAGALRRWCHDNQTGPHQPMFINSNGVALSRHGARFRLKLTLAKAAATCPALRNRSLGLHSFRHTCAMHLLQSGVSIEVIALWLGHEQLVTTHGYIEADIHMKEQTLQSLKEPKPARRLKRKTPLDLITFLDSL